MPTITEAECSAAMIVDLEEGEIPLRRLVREALRWRPSRLVVREVRQQQERLGPSPCAGTHTGRSQSNGAVAWLATLGRVPRGRCLRLEVRSLSRPLPALTGAHIWSVASDLLAMS